MTESVYIHVPFCSHICKYCAFFRQKNADHSRWLAKLIEDINRRKPEQPLETLYLGGGTPSCLELDELEQITNLFSLKPDCEATMEFNPEDVTDEKLEAVKALGINRISVGIQTFEDSLLKDMGRCHTAKQSKDAINKIKAHFTNWSLDLMFALPDQTEAMLKRDLETVLEIRPPHISLYSLILEENSIWGKTGMKPRDEDLEADWYEFLCWELKKAGYIHYEVSSFCLPGHASRHNLAYWQDADYAGFGPGASGYEAGKRYHINPDWSLEEEESDPAFEAIMMGLRTSYGVNLDKHEARYGYRIEDKYKSVLNGWKDRLEIKSGCLVCNEAGLEVLNSILVDFLEAS